MGLKKYEATTEHPTWSHNGEHVDLREINDKDAERLVKAGFKHLRKKATEKKTNVKTEKSDD